MEDADETAVDWANGLGIDVLALVAGGRDELKSMRGVNRSWKGGFQRSVKHIKVTEEGPLLPIDGSLARRFPGITSLDLGESLMGDWGLQSLRGLTKLIRLTLGSPVDSITSQVGQQVGPQAGQQVGQQLGQPFGQQVANQASRAQPELLPLPWRLTDSGLEWLRGLKLQQLDLSGCDEILTLGALEGMPLASLNLNWAYLDSDTALWALQGMPLQSLDLGWSWCQMDSDLACLRGLPLTTLILGCPDCPANVFSIRRPSTLTDSGLNILRGMPLTRLGLSACYKVRP